MKDNQVYVLDFGDQIKIGRSANPTMRFNTIETAAGRKIVRKFCITADPLYENLLHERLSKHRGIGEYFSYPYEEAVSLLQSLITENLVEKARLAKERELLEQEKQKQERRLERERVRLEKQAAKQKQVEEKRQASTAGKKIKVILKRRGMGISYKIKALLKLKGKTNANLASYLNISVQALSNKFYRDSYSGEDLIKIAMFLNCDLAFTVDETTKISIDKNDLKPNKEV